MSINNRQETDKIKLFSTFNEAMPGNKWSGRFTPEAGQKVEITLNGIGNGTIEGFFTFDGYVGVFVKPDNPPDWWKRQNAESGRTHCEVFGAEIMPAG